MTQPKKSGKPAGSNNPQDPAEQRLLEGIQNPSLASTESPAQQRGKGATKPPPKKKASGRDQAIAAAMQQRKSKMAQGQ